MKKIFLIATLFLALHHPLPAQLINAAIDACAVYHCDGVAIPDVHFKMGVTSPGLLPVNYDLGVTGASGCVPTLNSTFPAGSTLKFTPTKTGDPLKGVNTLDLILIVRHILGLEPLSSPYKMIAADANRSGSITTFDLVELQKLILGIYTELPNNTVWQFVDENFVFPNPNNPFQTAIPPVVDTIQPNLSKLFYGIKIGDVDCSYTQFTGQNPEEFLAIPDLNLQTNDTVEVPIQYLYPIGHQYNGFQFGLQFDSTKIQVLEVQPKVANLNSHLFSGQVNVLNLANPNLQTHIYFPQDRSVYNLRIKALSPVHLADVFHLDTTSIAAQSYTTMDSVIRLRLQFMPVVATQEADGEQQIFAPQPNPTTAGLRFPLRLAEAATVTIEVSDAMGRLIYRQEERTGAGDQLLDLPDTAFPQAGLYFWRVQTGKAHATGRIVRQ